MMTYKGFYGFRLKLLAQTDQELMFSLDRENVSSLLPFNYAKVLLDRSGFEYSNLHSDGVLAYFSIPMMPEFAGKSQDLLEQKVGEKLRKTRIKMRYSPIFIGLEEDVSHHLDRVYPTRRKNEFRLGLYAVLGYEVEGNQINFQLDINQPTVSTLMLSPNILFNDLDINGSENGDETYSGKFSLPLPDASKLVGYIEMVGALIVGTITRDYEAQDGASFPPSGQNDNVEEVETEDDPEFFDDSYSHEFLNTRF